MPFALTFPAEHPSHRPFRLPWTAQPDGTPGAHAESASREEAKVFASWNGATEVASWEVLAGPGPGRLKSLGSNPRDGFETAMLVRTSESYVEVQAKDPSGRVLGASEPVET